MENTDYEAAKSDMINMIDGRISTLTGQSIRAIRQQPDLRTDELADLLTWRIAAATSYHTPSS